MTATDYVIELLEEGFEPWRCIEFLHDGEAMLNLGITSEEEVDEALIYLYQVQNALKFNSRNQKESE